MKRVFASLFFVAVLFASGTASAHSFWITVTESLNHPPGHVTAILGFGHSVPMDDLLVGPHGTIRLSRYQLIAPGKKIFDLGAVDVKPIPTETTPTHLNVTTGDLGLRKISLTDKSVPGAYQIVAESSPIFVTTYVNTKGKLRVAPKPIDALKDVKEVRESLKFQSYSKAFFAVEKWTKPEALGQELEIIPLDDMSDIHAGDLIRFMVTYKGKPVNATSNFIASMSATSNTFGGPDGFHLSSYIIEGKAQFRLPTAGQWVVNTFYQQKVDGNPVMKELAGKCMQVFIGSSVGFNVKP